MPTANENALTCQISMEPILKTPENCDLISAALGGVPRRKFRKKLILTLS